MEELRAQPLHSAIHILDRIHCYWACAIATAQEGESSPAAKRFLTVEEQLHLADSLRPIEGSIRKSGLPTAAEAIQEFRMELADAVTHHAHRELSAADVKSRIEEVHRTIRREMRAAVFLYLPTDRVGWFRNPTADWDAVIARWPKSELDIIESSKCFALDRFAGSIFHVLLVAEFGVIQLCDLLGESGDKPGWGCVDRLQQILAKKYTDRTALQQQYSTLLKDLVPMIVAIKDSTRHKISHVDNKLVWLDVDFSPQIAVEVIGSTRGFMRRLAKDLP